MRVAAVRGHDDGRRLSVGGRARRATAEHPEDVELAQVNIARFLDAPRLRGFVAALDPVNALADTSPGFVWRLQTDEGDATAIRAFDDDMVIVNLSVWTSLEALATFVYRSDHAAVMRRRREWFEPPPTHHQALWWLPAGHRPTPAEARGRLEHLRTQGPTAWAFTFTTAFGPTQDELPGTDDAWLCPA